MVGAVGDDGYGRWVLDDLNREGVGTQGMCLVQHAFTPMVMAIIETNGERLVTPWPPDGGANQQLQVDDINPALMASASWLHTTGICLRASPIREAVLHAMELARRVGLTVSLDLNLRLESWGLDAGTQSVFEQAIELSDVLMGNAEEEIMPLTGADLAQAAAQYLCGGKRIVVARQGSKGVLVATDMETLYVPAFQTQVVDTLGAGDAFNGGFIAARLANYSLKKQRAGGMQLPR